jgi:NAD(P)-dependent dehydrogenase (short-subunit alcohol dehydrogenase family)
MSKILEGRVAVVTGSGRGLGRAYAMAIAQQGAKVVINDLGCETDGTGSSHLPADQVTAEINQAGGVAVANYDSVTTSAGADRIIKTAVDHFGRLDILVNNAGVGRDRLIFDMTDEDFDIVIKTHLYGTFYCTRAASRIMKEQKYGRIVNIASIAGFGFTAGEASYASAKEGIASLTRTVSRDLVKYGITCNAIRPQANTRLGPIYVEEQTRIGNILGVPMFEPGNFEAYGVPEDVAPLVVFLVSEQAKDVSNRIFEIHSKYVALYDNPPQKTMTLNKKESRFTVEELLRLLPQTLTKGTQLPNPTAAGKDTLTKLAPGAKGWLWADGNLNDVPPN